MVAPRAPAWVMSGAKFDLDFANGRYWGGGVNLGAYQNGLTSMVAGNVSANSNSVYAPDSTGKLIPCASGVPRITSGMGLWAEPSRTVYNLWARDLTNSTWTKTNITTTKNQVGADGITNSATLIAATGANAIVTQAMSVASTAIIGTAYIKRISGTGTLSMTIDGSTWTNVTSQIAASGYNQVSVPPQTIANPITGFMIASPGDSFAIDFVNCSSGTVPSTPLLTTSSTNTFYNEEPTLNVVSGPYYNCGQRILKEIVTGGCPYSMFAKYTGTPSLSGVAGGSGWIVASDGPISIAGGADGSFCSFAGVKSSNNGNAGLGNLNKVAARLNGAGSSICMNAGPISFSAFNNGNSGPGTAITHCGLGNNGSGNASGPLNGYIARLVFWNKEITDSQMYDFTR